MLLNRIIRDQCCFRLLSVQDNVGLSAVFELVSWKERVGQPVAAEGALNYGTVIFQGEIFRASYLKTKVGTDSTAPLTLESLGSLEFETSESSDSHSILRTDGPVDAASTLLGLLSSNSG